MSIFASTPPSYAHEALNRSLTALSTIPISIPLSVLGNDQPQAQDASDLTIEKALRDLSTSRPITRKQLEAILDGLTQHQEPATSSAHGLVNRPSATPVDKVREAQIMARAVTVVWRETLDVAMKAAMEIERDLDVWQGIVESRREIGLYFIQSLPLRLYRLIPNPFRQSAFHIPSFSSVHINQLFPPSSGSRPRSLRATAASTKNALNTLRDLPLPVHNPFTLTRREILASLKVLRAERDEVARKIGFLVTHAPRWEEEAGRTSDEDNLQAIVAETSRLYTVVCAALDMDLPPTARTSSHLTPTTPIGSPNGKRSKRETSSRANSSASPPPPPLPTASTLLPILRETLPSALSSLTSPLIDHGRPSRITRLWIPLLLLPPLLRYASRSARDNQDWIRMQFNNVGDTIKGWAVGWVIQPLEGVVQTLRGGGEGLGVAPETVRSDQASLERMVIDLGRDYYHLSGDALNLLGEKIKAGNMDDVLRVYESEMKSPVKNAVMGNLIRTLLIQVQKTKYDLSLSLLSLDHLLRSQQLTFAFVGLAPSLLLLYGIGGWTKRIWTGERRGSNRRSEYAKGIRNVEKLLIGASASEDEMKERDRGMLILAVGKLRSWAAGLRASDRGDFIDDLRLLETPKLDRDDKLRVVDRIWRTSVLNGRKGM